jgi:hypothetical protein
MQAMGNVGGVRGCQSTRADCVRNTSASECALGLQMELLEIRLHELTLCAKPEPCCGITYILISTNRSDGKRYKAAAYWTAFSEIEKFQVLGD